MKSMTALFLLAALLLLSGCETFHGLGRDIENAGKGIERAGEWVQEKAE